MKDYLEKVKNDKIKSIVILLVGWLQAVMGFLAALNIKYDWLNDASISAFGIVVTATLMLFVGIYTVWKNTFFGKKAIKQNEELHKRGLK